MSDDSLRPRDHAEAIALFRAEVIGALAHREFLRGELAKALRELAQVRFRAPGSRYTRCIAVSTLERWYYRYRCGGLTALKPEPRSDRGRARELTLAQRALLLDIRREHPTASVPLILRTLIADGRLPKDAVSETTIARLYRDAGLPRGVRPDGHTRLRWQAERPGALWHGDVCHGTALRVGDTTRPLRVHALMDDASRYVVALEAHHTEREADMLGLMYATVRRSGAPDGLYLDNGATYSGEALRIACERLDITLIHAKPYDAPARGKMERFWRTLREGCLDHLGTMSSLHEVQARLLAFLDEHYHKAPHGGLLGKTPAEVWAEARTRLVDEAELSAALTVHTRRRVRKDGTIDISGVSWQLDQGFLAGCLVTIAVDTTGAAPPVVEHDGRRYVLHSVDVVAAGKTRRKRPAAKSDQANTVPFDPAGVLLDQFAGRPPRHRTPEED